MNASQNELPTAEHGAGPGPDGQVINGIHIAGAAVVHPHGAKNHSGRADAAMPFDDTLAITLYQGANAVPLSRVTCCGKRARDICRSLSTAPERVLAGILLGLALPLIVALMTITTLTSRGPALYTQWRVGRDGRRFRIYKIRTMVHDCERYSGPRWASPDDDRVTGIGRFLRRTHLDELPQLWNIVLGDMSFIGPRPERPEIIDQIVREIPSYVLRTAIEPGITGLAQIILGPDVDMSGVRRKLDCDRYYMTRRGFGLNCKILLATPFKMIGLPASVLVFVFRLPSLEDCQQFVGGLEQSNPRMDDRLIGER